MNDRRDEELSMLHMSNTMRMAVQSSRGLHVSCPLEFLLSDHDVYICRIEWHGTMRVECAIRIHILDVTNQYTESDNGQQTKS